MEIIVFTSIMEMDIPISCKEIGCFECETFGGQLEIFDVLTFK